MTSLKKNLFAGSADDGSSTAFSGTHSVSTGGGGRQNDQQRIKCCNIFISCRFVESKREGEMIKSALEAASPELKVFLCSVLEGDSIVDAIAESIDDADLVVILGTATYGMRTDSSYSTYQELGFIMSRNKPFFLLKMCQEFEMPRAKFLLQDTISAFFWLEHAKHETVPAQLVNNILKKYASLTGQSSREIVDVLSDYGAHDVQLSTAPKGHLRDYLAAQGPITMVTRAKAPSIRRLSLPPPASSPAKLDIIDQVRMAIRLGNRNEFCSLFRENGYNLPVATACAQELRKDVTGRDDYAETEVYEILAEAMLEFGELDMEFAKEACGAVANLGWGQARNKELLAEAGICSRIANTLKAFGTKSPDVACHGSWAVWVLAVDPVNSRELGDVGACESVVACLNAFSLKNSEASKKAIGAIKSLCSGNEDNKFRMSNAVAHVAILQALDLYGARDHDIVKDGCRALCMVLPDRDKHESLKDARCYAIILRLMDVHSGKSLSKECLEVVNKIIERSPKGLQEFSSRGICPRVSAVSKAFGTRDHESALAISKAMAFLMREFSKDPNPYRDKNAAELIACDAHLHLAELLRCFGSKYVDIASHALYAITKLASRNPKVKEELHSAGTCQNLFVIIVTIKATADEPLAIRCLNAYRALTSNYKPGTLTFASQGIEDALIQFSKTNGHNNVEFVGALARAFANCSTLDGSSRLLLRLGVLDELVSICRKHADDSEVMHDCYKLLARLECEMTRPQVNEALRILKSCPESDDKRKCVSALEAN